MCIIVLKTLGAGQISPPVETFVVLAYSFSFPCEHRAATALKNFCNYKFILFGMNVIEIMCVNMQGGGKFITREF